MKYVGDISRQDVHVLIKFATRSLSILEFGCGGSTQVIAQSKPARAEFFSVETDVSWIERTRSNFVQLNIPENACSFFSYETWNTALSGKTFDFIFVDGIDSERLRFSINAWASLRIGAWMAFHDTRRLSDFQNVLKIVSENFLEINQISCNTMGSNISAIQKKISEPYVNWNIVENRQAWMTGHGLPPDNMKDLL